MKLINSLIVVGSVGCVLSFSAFAQPTAQPVTQTAGQAAQQSQTVLAYYHHRNYYGHRHYGHRHYGNYRNCRTVCNGHGHCWRRCW